MPSGQMQPQAGGTWMNIFNPHHQNIDQLIQQTSDRDAERKTQLLKQLNGALTAHSVAEENVLYPAMSIAGVED